MTISSKLAKEDTEVLEYFVSKLPECEKKEEILHYLEALYFERKMRIGNEMETLDNLDQIVEKKITQMNNSENVIKRLHYEIKLFKQLGEIKNLRHAGMYRERDILSRAKQKQGIHLGTGGVGDVDDSSGVYDWIVDIDLITGVRFLVQSRFFPLFFELFSSLLFLMLRFSFWPLWSSFLDLGSKKALAGEFDSYLIFLFVLLPFFPLLTFFVGFYG